MKKEIKELKQRLKELEDKQHYYEDFPNKFEDFGEWKSKTLHLFTNDSGSLGVGSVEVENICVVSSFNIKLLEKMIKSLKALDMTEVDIIMGKDCPIGFGKVEKDNQFIGIMLAPKVDDDD